MEFLHIYKFIAILSSLLVVTASNPVHSVLFLVLVFCSSAALLFCLGVEFVALIFVVVYVGAIAVLFLFVCMMLNIKLEEMQKSITNIIPILFFLLILEVLFLSFYDDAFMNNAVFFVGGLYLDFFSLFFQLDNLAALGFSIYSFNVMAFILGGLVLLVAMIGAIQLTLYHRLDVKRQFIFEQVRKEGIIFF